MSSRREQCILALMAALATISPAVPVERNRRSPLDDVAEAPRLVVHEGSQTGQSVDFGLMQYVMQIDVEGTVTAASDALIGPALNSLYASVLVALGTDPSLGGVCIDVRETALDVRVAPAVESTTPLAEFALGLEIEFHTPLGDPAG